MAPHPTAPEGWVNGLLSHRNRKGRPMTKSEKGHSRWSDIRRPSTPERRKRVDAIKDEMVEAERREAEKPTSD